MTGSLNSNIVHICLHYKIRVMGEGTGIRGQMRGMATLPQGNQELLMVRDEVRRPPGELGVSKSHGM